jgi:hypothetical protein
MLTLNLISRQGFANQYTFAFVRDPWERIVSEWLWREKLWQVNYKQYARASGNKPPDKPPELQLSSHRFKAFIGMVKKTIKQSQPIGAPGYNSFMQHIRPQVDFTHDSLMNQKIDFIGRFENLQLDFDTVCDAIGISRRKLPVTNSSLKIGNTHYSSFYDDEILSHVSHMYRRDIEVFGYEFKQPPL